MVKGALTGEKKPHDAGHSGTFPYPHALNPSSPFLPSTSSPLIRILTDHPHQPPTPPTAAPATPTPTTQTNSNHTASPNPNTAPKPKHHMTNPSPNNPTANNHSTTAAPPAAHNSTSATPTPRPASPQAGSRNGTPRPTAGSSSTRPRGKQHGSTPSPMVRILIMGEVLLRRGVMVQGMMRRDIRIRIRSLGGRWAGCWRVVGRRGWLGGC